MNGLDDLILILNYLLYHAQPLPSHIQEARQRLEQRQANSQPFDESVPLTDAQIKQQL